jgi:regulator of replication initiation timing
MGAIKDIVDLITQLNSIMLKIQTLILTVQEEDAALVSENLDLKKKIFELEKKYSAFEEKHSAPQEKSSTENLQDKYVFIKELGIYKSKESGHYFCASCLMKNIESPLTQKQGGWRCELKDCGIFYKNPAYQAPKRKPRKLFQWS